MRAKTGIKNPFNIFCFITVLLLLFTVGYQIGRERIPEERISVIVRIGAEKISGEPLPSSSGFVDEKYEVQLMSREDRDVYILCEGSLTEAGFLLSGAKYLSANQPINLYGENFGVEGRIISLLMPRTT